MVTPLSLARLRIAEMLGLCSDVLELGKRFDLVAITVNTHFDMFENAQKPMRDLYAVEKGNPLSQSLEAADFRRDEAIIGLRGLAESYARHFVAAKVEAGKTLLRTIEKYGSNIYSRNYQEETEILRNLVDDLQKPGPVKDAVVALGQADWVAELDAANKNFNKLFLDRNASEGQKPAGNMKECRLHARKSYETLVNIVNAKELLNSSPALITLITEWNLLVDKYALLIANRKSGDSADSPSPTE